MTALRLIVVLVLVGGVVALPAQSPSPAPNFSGHWFIDKATIEPSAMRPVWVVCGWDCVMTHTAAELTVTPATGAVKTFATGGNPVTTTIEGFGQVTTQTTSARWEQQRLVITVITGASDEFTSTTRLAFDAGRLVVTTTRVGGRGSQETVASYMRKPASRMDPLIALRNE